MRACLPALDVSCASVTVRAARWLTPPRGRIVGSQALHPAIAGGDFCRFAWLGTRVLETPTNALQHIHRMVERFCSQQEALPPASFWEFHISGATGIGSCSFRHCCSRLLFPTYVSLVPVGREGIRAGLRYRPIPLTLKNNLSIMTCSMGRLEVMHTKLIYHRVPGIAIALPVVSWGLL